MLLYQARYVERLAGSRKYLSMIAVVNLLATVALIGILIVFGNSGIFESAEDLEGFAGPHVLAFAMLTVMAFEVPATHPYSILGIPLSEKLFSYLLALQLAVARSYYSIVPSVIGIVVGVLYSKNIGGLADFRLPNIVTDFITKAVAPLVEEKKRTAVLNQNQNQNGNQNVAAAPVARVNPQVRAAAPQPQAQPGAAAQRPAGIIVFSLRSIGLLLFPSLFVSLSFSSLSLSPFSLDILFTPSLLPI